MSLNAWLADEHLAPHTKVEGAPRLGDAAVVVIDNLLRAEMLAKLQPLFGADAVWDDGFGVLRKKGMVSEAEFESTDPANRLYQFRVLQSAPRDRPMAPGWVCWILLQQFFQSPEFMRFVSAASGITPSHYLRAACHLMRQGHFIRPHSDRGQSRILCGVLYVNNGWQPGYGGEFEILSEGRTLCSVEPLTNRLILFSPRAAPVHAVCSLTATAGAWERHSITIWWSGDE